MLVEKEALDFVFRYLQEETDWNILLKPNEKEWDAYCTGDNIVMLNLISEASKCVDEIYSLREAKQNAQVAGAEREGMKKRISEMQQCRVFFLSFGNIVN